jgi:subtilisin family serine protease
MSESFMKPVSIGRLILMIAFTIVFCLSSESVAQDIKVEYEVERMRNLVEKFILDLTGASCEENRFQEKPADVECCKRAIRQAANELERADLKKGAWDSLKLAFDMTKEVIEALLLPELEGIKDGLDVAEVLINILDSDTFKGKVKAVATKGLEKAAGWDAERQGLSDVEVKLNEELAKLAVDADELAELVGGWVFDKSYEEFLKQVLGETGERWTETTNKWTTPCPVVTVRSLLKAVPGSKILQLNIQIYGDCKCKYPNTFPFLKDWFVMGRMFLVPQIDFDKASKTMKVKFVPAGPPEYKVQANCCNQMASTGTFTPFTPATAQPVGFLPGYVIAYDNSQWCTYIPGLPDDPRDVPTPDDPRDVPTPDDPRDTPTPDDPRDTPTPDDPRDIPTPDDPRDTPKPDDPGDIPWPDDPRDKPTPDDPRDKPEPDDPRDVPTPDDPRDKPTPDDPRDTPVPPPTLTIKAKTSVVESGKTVVRNLNGALVKFSAAAPGLPIAGNKKDEKTGHDADPIQGVTGADGTLVVGSSGPQPPSSEQAEPSGPVMEVDLTPLESKNVALKPTALSYLEPGPSALSYLKTAVPANLQQHVSQTFVARGTALMLTLTYPKNAETQVNNWVEQRDDVIYSEPNYCRDKQADDPYYISKGSWKQKYDDQWAIKRVGLTTTSDSAWSQLKQPKPVVVAIIDTGLDWNHQDISWDQIWKNPKEVANNKIDDDKNGYVDDVIGWNFIGKNNLPWDDDGHGTFVAGVIAATKGNGIGISGINPYAQIMVLKALNAFGHTRASYLAEAILYAADNGARIINISVGGKKLTRTEQMAIDHAHKKGANLIIAAGNEAVDIADFGPAGNDHVIAVAASDLTDKPANYSNWGAGIDITAPGNDILSLRARSTDLMRDIPEVKYIAGESYVGADKRYYRASGTSFAAPIVAGVASLILTVHPNVTNEQVERMLLQSSKDINVPGNDQLTGYGLLNAGAALKSDPNFFISAEISGVSVVSEGSTQSLQVTGIADADQIKRYWLEIGSGENPTQWKRVAKEGSQPVKRNVLGVIPASEFQGSPSWIIKLVIEHQNGKSREARFDLKLE